MRVVAEVVQDGLEEGSLPGDGDRIGQRQPFDGEVVQAPFMAVAVVDLGQVEEGGRPARAWIFCTVGARADAWRASQVVR